MFIQLVSKVMLVLFVTAMSGCVTLMDESTVGEQKAEVETLKADVHRLSDQVVEVRQSLLKIQEELQGVNNSQSSEVKDSKSRLDEIERSLKTVESTHDQMKREIIEDLAKRIEKLGTIAGSSPGKTSGRNGGMKPESKKPERGYEHVVKPGETLSAIASAYNVSPAVVIRANNIAKPNDLKVGQKLFIPE